MSCVDICDAPGRRNRARPPLASQPAIIGLTAHATAEYRDICLSAGMDGYMTKPLDPEKLRTPIAGISARCPSGDLAAAH